MPAQDPDHHRPATFRHWIEYLAVRLFICVVQSMRIETCATLSRFLAFIANDIVRLRRGVIDENLRQALPDESDARRNGLRREMWRHLFTMICEIAHAPRKLQRTNWREYVSIENESGYVDLLLDERPTVIVSGHFGNFEVAGYVCGLFGFPTYTIARTLDNPLLDHYVKRFREAKGQFILPKDGSAQEVQQVLDRGEPLVLLGDQNAGPKGQWVRFLGRPASCHKAVALFSLGHRAPLLVSLVRRQDRALHFVIGFGGLFDPLRADPGENDVRQLTAWYNARLEEAIRRFPAQYWWVHRRWKGEPSARQRKQLERQELKAAGRSTQGNRRQESAADPVASKAETGLPTARSA